jgi:hypothetical protein
MGDLVGRFVGFVEGFAVVGKRVGLLLGVRVGSCVGVRVGNVDGLAEGKGVGG